MFSERTKEKGRPAVAALLQGFAVGALLLCGSAPAFAVATFDAQAGIFLEIPRQTNLDVAIPTNNSHLYTQVSTQTLPDALVSASAGAGPVYSEENPITFPVPLFAYVEVSGSATTGSAAASAFASSYVFLENLGSGTLGFQILFDLDSIANPGDSPAYVIEDLSTSGPGEVAFVDAGWVVSLFLEDGEDSWQNVDDLLDVLFDDEDENQIGWFATLAPNVQYKLEISAAASGRASAAAVPEPATLALFGLGLAGIGAVRRRKLAA